MSSNENEIPVATRRRVRRLNIVSDDSDDEAQPHPNSSVCLVRTSSPMTPTRRSPRVKAASSPRRVSASQPPRFPGASINGILLSDDSSGDEPIRKRPIQNKNTVEESPVVVNTRNNRQQSRRTRAMHPHKRKRVHGYKLNEFVVDDSDEVMSEDDNADNMSDEGENSANEKPAKRSKRAEASDSEPDACGSVSNAWSSEEDQSQSSSSSDSGMPAKRRVLSAEMQALHKQREMDLREALCGRKVPSNLQDPIICAICRFHKLPMFGTSQNGFRDGWIQPANNFSENVRRGKYGVRMENAFCLAHSIGHQLDYVKRLTLKLKEDQSGSGPRREAVKDTSGEDPESSEDTSESGGFIVHSPQNDDSQSVSVLDELRAESEEPAVFSSLASRAKCNEVYGVEPTYLMCPYGEKEAAKILGAKWDPARRQWFVPPGINLNLFSRWMPHS